MNTCRGVLIVNLGTPRSPRPYDVFRYLNEFLTDERVIDLPWLQRQLLVRGVVVPFRFRQSAEQDSRLWTPEGSPLMVHGRAVRDKLQHTLGSSFKVVLAMRYATPSILEGLEQLKQANVDELLILPLFPQYASATTGSVHQKVMESLAQWSIIPQTTFINHFYNHPAFIKACTVKVKEHVLDDYDHLLISFHGLPERQIRKNDSSGKCLKGACCDKITQNNHACYKAQCVATAKAIAQELSLKEKDYTICFQSRLGKDPWLQPYVSDVLREQASKGSKKLLVACPSFVCDCLETILEISHEYAQEFKRQGGERLQLVEGLNSHSSWIDALSQLVQEHINCSR